MFGMEHIIFLGNEYSCWYYINALGIVPALIWVAVVANYKKSQRLLCPYISSKEKKACSYFSSNKTKRIIFILFALIEIILFGGLQFFLNYKSNLLMGAMIPGTGQSNYYGSVLLSPIFLSLFCYIMSVNPIGYLDKITPSYGLILAVSSFANYLAGCCSGKIWDNGLFNRAHGEVEHPAPLYSMAGAIIIFIVLYFYQKKSKKGTVWPVYVILYSANRFINQCFRADYEDIFFSLDIYQIISIVTFLIGIILFVVFFIFGERLNSFFSNHLPIDFLPETKAKKTNPHISNTNKKRKKKTTKKSRKKNNRKSNKKK